MSSLTRSKLTFLLLGSLLKQPIHPEWLGWTDRGTFKLIKDENMALEALAPAHVYKWRSAFTRQVSGRIF
jgi:hypothetical protein